MPKHALVVDDSRVARAILGKFLVEYYRLTVDMAESAEDALQYLASNPPPHVIFMDHMMPGMDGLQAVVAIKKNAHTGMIPIVMYTSKEGAAYMGQARALGAVGVLSKPIKPLELQEIVQSLNLATDTAAVLTPAFSTTLRKNPPANIRAKDNVAALELDPDDFIPDRQQSGGDMTLPIKRLLEEQRAKIKQDLQVQGDLVVHKVVEWLQTSETPAFAKTASRTVAFLPAKRAGIALAIISLIAITYFLYPGSDDSVTKSKTPAETAAVPEGWNDAAIENSAGPAGVESQTAASKEKIEFSEALERQRLKSAEEKNKLLKTIEWLANMNGGFSYDQTPLDDERLALVSELVSRLSLIDIKGTLRLSVHAGDFCLVRSESGAFKLPSDDAPIQNCQLLGLSQEQLLPPHQSPAFSRFLAAAPYNNGDLRVVTIFHGKEQPSYKYPAFSSVRTAGEWNRIASQNNRVEIRILPAPP